jgi:hypothetical protein
MECYGVHQLCFDQSPLFQEIIRYGETDKIGVTPLHPISFNTLKKEIFNDFLHLLYFGIKQLRYLKQKDWINIKRLSMDLLSSDSRMTDSGLWRWIPKGLGLSLCAVPS